MASVFPDGPPLEALSVVLPCYDEEANVERVVREAVAVARAAARSPEVVVVDDGSRDRTPQLLEGLAAELPELRIVRHAANLGYGAALASGFRAARGAWVFYTDGDGQFDPAELLPLLPRLRSDRVIVGFRAPRSDPPMRVLNGFVWTRLVDALLGVGVRDVNCAFKLFPKSLLERVPMASVGAAIDAELLAGARRLGYGIDEVPVSHRPRVRGRATGAHPRVVLQALVELRALAAAHRAAPHRLPVASPR
ncbi:MAG TPA: glycosyltransferase family 2 protein [Polyangiaceae bacterium LLY-WYZ-15_(1-7)]|nr:cell wall biosynthesis glycosyltransferase [Myxococcales bacterium]MAT25233.1 cell wall biosynthesis glycosyltransferase [Sandaracinus sp.]HJL03549.1 glycosyltransferase family 2 protein [Polyangiaceae bacterium LLY-WYZ-15_(1-7)]MBJ73909.1 cell wall biosynthesis glycosyltransferase [Sandaracinus sp.]HJL09409.1 glycosyltransferase family 2 protein [Polyangiaceae bacterium LLY-WYZ-15_(1-7)]